MPIKEPLFFHGKPSLNLLSNSNIPVKVDGSGLLRSITGCKGRLREHGLQVPGNFVTLFTLLLWRSCQPFPESHLSYWAPPMSLLKWLQNLLPKEQHWLWAHLMKNQLKWKPAEHLWFLLQMYFKPAITNPTFKWNCLL